MAIFSAKNFFKFIMSPYKDYYYIMSALVLREFLYQV
jgi:hypothetical protein